ncbi:hypothetical protein GFS31_04610 [Leptolyngbya sp. BL0902]|uniref:hypothetical protein n=1 Tax=Leptolyngbya sp. BL0902 TaxID=1115757 RepID=UPI0018E70CEF|nr:hypothetical protein [Leptolyngbya sp. BL0902]QQE63792.1 hypothetical protein GFS31_04610 [Leptolyngbya sp. BL0902]
MNRLVGVIVAINLGLALGGLYLAWRLWWLKQTLSLLADNLTIWERDLRDTLALADHLDLSRQQLLRLRQQYILLQRWLGYLPYLRQGLKLLAGVGTQRRQRLRRRGRT